MRKSIMIIRDDKGLSVQTGEGFLSKDFTCPLIDPKAMILMIFGLLGIGNDYIVVLRKRRKA